MNRILTLSAIAMFAVVLGLGVVAPAVSAVKMPQVNVCHNDDGADEIRGTPDDGWEQKFVNGNAVSKHVANHFDENGVFDFAVVDAATQATCTALIVADPLP